VELGIDAAGMEAGHLVVRPEYLRKLDPGDGADVSFPATVDNDYMLGSRTQFHLTVGDAILVAELAASAATGVDVGQRSRWGFDVSDATVIRK
jgi:spermidine/putrescine transport system ATP-binding protein